jgi:hypothetical protein
MIHVVDLDRTKERMEDDMNKLDAACKQQAKEISDHVAHAERQIPSEISECAQ